MEDRELDHEVSHGQVASPSSKLVSHPAYYRRPHCESCGALLMPIISGTSLVAYSCPVHGITHHSGIVWVWHEEDE